jgi:hypothetical protein
MERVLFTGTAVFTAADLEMAAPPALPAFGPTPLEKRFPTPADREMDGPTPMASAGPTAFEALVAAAREFGELRPHTEATTPAGVAGDIAYLFLLQELGAKAPPPSAPALTRADVKQAPAPAGRSAPPKAVTRQPLKTRTHAAFDTEPRFARTLTVMERRATWAGDLVQAIMDAARFARPFLIRHYPNIAGIPPFEGLQELRARLAELLRRPKLEVARERHSPR